MMIALPCGQLAQQLGVGEGQPDPPDAEQRAADRDRRRSAAGHAAITTRNATGSVATATSSTSRWVP